MDDTSLKETKEALLKEKNRLADELLTIAEKNEKIADDFNSRFPNWGDDVDSNAAEVDTYSSRLGIERNLESMIKNINTVLEKIDKGTYGLCEKCGGPIQEARIKAFPAAIYCMKCSK